MEGLNVGSMKVAKSGVIHGPIKHHLPLLHKTKSKTRFTYLLSASPNYSPTACSVGLVLNETDLKHSRLNKVRYRHELSEMGGVGNTCSQATVPCPGFQAGPFHIHVSCVTDTPSAGSELYRYSQKRPTAQ